MAKTKKAKHSKKPTVSRKELYEMIRSQIAHEDSLVNQRLNWLLLSQGFLITFFTAVISHDTSSPLLSEICSIIVLFSITLVGVSLNLLSFMGIRAAYDSLKHLRQTWYYPYRTEEESQKLNEGFPQITWIGGWKAINTAKGTPMAILIIWIVLACTIVQKYWVIVPIVTVGIHLLVFMIRETFGNQE